MKNIFYFLITLVCLTLSNLNAQVDPKIETNRLMNLLTNLEGTYQVQIVDSRELPTIPLSLMDTIIATRDQTKVKFVWLSEKVRVKILSTDVISAPNFQGLPRVKHISASDLN